MAETVSGAQGSCVASLSSSARNCFQRSCACNPTDAPSRWERPTEHEATAHACLGGQESRISLSALVCLIQGFVARYIPPCLSGAGEVTWCNAAQRKRFILKAFVP